MAQLEAAGGGGGGGGELGSRAGRLTARERDAAALRENEAARRARFEAAVQKGNWASQALRPQQVRFAVARTPRAAQRTSDAAERETFTGRDSDPEGKLPMGVPGPCSLPPLQEGKKEEPDGADFTLGDEEADRELQVRRDLAFLFALGSKDLQLSGTLSRTALVRRAAVLLGAQESLARARRMAAQAAGGGGGGGKPNPDAMDEGLDGGAPRSTVEEIALAAARAREEEEQRIKERLAAERAAAAAAAGGGGKKGGAQGPKQLSDTMEFVRNIQVRIRAPRALSFLSFISSAARSAPSARSCRMWAPQTYFLLLAWERER